MFAAAELLAEAEQANEVLPSSTDHLSEASRKHFEELLEYLEATDTPYELAPSLLSRGSAWTETCFEVRAGGITAWGSRYSELVKPFFRPGFPCVGAIIRIVADRDGGGAHALVPERNTARPRFVFVHIGEEAKRESIRLTDVLRHAHVSLTQAVGIESLTEQMRYAEATKAPYLLIMGRKEALERSVILRECATHIEHILPLDRVVDRLRKVA